MAIKDILIKIKGDNKDFDKKLKNTDKSMSGFAGSMKKHSGAIKAGLIGIGIAAAVMSTKMVSSTIQAGVAIDKMAKSTGLAYEQVSRLKYAADQEHTSIESLNTGFRKLSKTMYDANEGLAESERTFASLGISIHNVDGSLRAVDSVVMETADIFANMTDDTKKAALAQELFGRSGMDMIPLLELGSAGINELGDEAERLGLVMSETAAKDMKAFDDQMTKMKGAIAGTGVQLTTALMPHLLEFADWLSMLVDKGYIDNFVAGVRMIGNTFLLAITPLQMFINTLKAMHDAIQDPMDIKAIISRTTEANKALLSGKMDTLEALNNARIDLFSDHRRASGIAQEYDTQTRPGGPVGGPAKVDTFDSGSMMTAVEKGISAEEYSQGEFSQWSEVIGTQRETKDAQQENTEALQEHSEKMDESRDSLIESDEIKMENNDKIGELTDIINTLVSKMDSSRTQFSLGGRFI